MVLAGQPKSSLALEGIEKCNECSYKSSSWKHLKDHIIRTHLRNTFQCDQCDKALTEKNCLRTHFSFFMKHFSSSETNAHSRGTLKDIYTSILSGYLKARGANVNIVMTCLLGKQPWQSTLNFDMAWTKSHLAVCVSSVESQMPPKW